VDGATGYLPRIVRPEVKPNVARPGRLARGAEIYADMATTEAVNGSDLGADTRL